MSFKAWSWNWNKAAFLNLGCLNKSSHWVSVVRGLGCGHDASFFLSQTLSSGSMRLELRYKGSPLQLALKPTHTQRANIVGPKAPNMRVKKSSYWVPVVCGPGCGHDASFFLSQTLSSGLLLTVGREYFTRLFVHCSDLSLEINYSQVDPKEI